MERSEPKWKCNICGRTLHSDSEAIEHALRCGIPEGQELEYWRAVVRLAFERVLPMAMRRELTDEYIKAGIPPEEARAILILVAFKIITPPKSWPLSEAQPEDYQAAFLNYAPEAIQALLEYMGIIARERRKS